ncbi:MAG: Asp-tRNA(Asn)/Glu-tRNA(Gln) amidotransferase subunit GatA [Pirellulales bacterium]|nr:Asp-tRNA(Asn)/Glu-tRNA(Gln) amidotransferase subunit GatA [Pirellulales bacterium]
MDLTQSTASSLLELLGTGQLTSVELTRHYLDRIATHDARIGAFLRVDADSSLAQARAIDAKRQAGQPVGLLGGLPVAVKDVIAQRGELLTCGSRMLENFRSPYDAGIIERLTAADAVLLGRTNMDEFAMGGSNENSAYFPCRNPWNTACIPGGSSGGAAAAIAADFAPLSIGTDTGGSIRQPAGLCGVTGLKPTYGRVSRYGLVAFASSLDQIGPLAHTARDAALLLQVIAGHDPRDSTSVNAAVPPYSQTVTQPLAGLRLGIVPEHFAAGLDGEVAAAVKSAINVYETLGASVREVELPHAQYAVATYYIIAPCEASSNLARYDGVHYGRRAEMGPLTAELAAERKELLAAGRAADAAKVDNNLVRMYRQSRAEGFGTEVKRRIMIGAYALSAGYYDAYYVKALKVRRLIRQDYDRAFEHVDLIVGPVSPTTAFPIGQKANDPLAMYLDDLYTVSANLAGIGGIAIPCGMSAAGLPIGLQLTAPPFQEDRLLRAAHMFQTATDWHTRRPKM